LTSWRIPAETLLRPKKGRVIRSNVHDHDVEPKPDSIMKTRQNLIRLWPVGALCRNMITSGGLGGGFTSLNLPNHFFVTNSNYGVFLIVGDGGPVGFVGSACMGTNLTCSFQTEAGQSYTLEYNEDLNPTNWEAYYTLTGDGSIVQCLMPMAGTPQCFFRVRQP
jgi:hypothetical protein